MWRDESGEGRRSGLQRETEGTADAPHGSLLGLWLRDVAELASLEASSRSAFVCVRSPDTSLWHHCTCLSITVVSVIPFHILHVG